LRELRCTGDVEAAGTRKPIEHSSAEGDFEPIEATALLQMPNFKQLVKPIWDGLLKPIITPVAGAFATIYCFQMSSGLAMSLEAALSDVVSRQFYSAVTEPLNRQLVPQITEVITDQLPPNIATSMKEFVVNTITDRVTDSVTKRVMQTSARKIYRQYVRAGGCLSSLTQRNIAAQGV
jgi:hypothetical protein